MRAEAQRTEMAGTRPRQRLRAAQFDDDDGRIEGEEGEGRGDRRPSGWWWYEIKEGWQCQDHRKSNDIAEWDSHLPLLKNDVMLGS